MKLISWNVNGLRACIKKGFEDSFHRLDADIFCLQEIKMKPEQLDISFEGYNLYINSAERPGYSGTAVFSREEPKSINFGLGYEEHDQEGRVITLEYDNFYFVNCYTPNSKQKLERLEYRMVWEDVFRGYLKSLEQKKPVILGGDLNVAHQPIDLKNPSSNRRSAGFTDEEREKMSVLLNHGFIDTFRHFYPDKKEEYSYWSYFRKARERNAGWRIDYFLTSDVLKQNLKDATIHQDIFGSDHCPVGLEIEI